MTNLNITFTII